MQKRAGGGGNRIQLVFNNKRDIFSVLIRREERKKLMPGRFYESDNGKSEEFPSCYLYFLNEVRNEVLCESEGKEKLCKM